MSNGCAITGCTKGGRLRVGMCQMHYRRWHLYGKGYRVAQKSDGSWDWEHIVIAEKALGRPMPKGALVHHVNFDPSDNSKGNLVICPSDAYHRLLHTRTAALDACGDPNARKCTYCKQYDSAERITRTAGGKYYHKRCHAAFYAAYRATKRDAASKAAA